MYGNKMKLYSKPRRAMERENRLRTRFQSPEYRYLEQAPVFRDYKSKRTESGTKYVESFDEEEQEQEDSDFEDKLYEPSPHYGHKKVTNRYIQSRTRKESVTRNAINKPVIKCPYCRLGIALSKVEIHVLNCKEKMKYEKYMKLQKYKNEQENYITEKLSKLKINKVKYGKKLVNFNDTSYNSEDFEDTQESDEIDEVNTSNLSSGVPLEVEDGIMKIPDSYKSKKVEEKTRYYDPCTNRNNHLMHIQQNTLWLKNIRDTLANAGYVGQSKAKPQVKPNQIGKKFYISSSDNEGREVDSNGYAIPRGQRIISQRINATLKVARDGRYANENLYANPYKLAPKHGCKQSSRTHSNLSSNVRNSSKIQSAMLDVKNIKNMDAHSETENQTTALIKRKCGRCRAKYPSIHAKFCAECGQRRE